MAFLTNRKYSFHCDALHDDTVAVVEFSGEEGLSRPYRFDILIAAGDMEIDLDAAVQGTASFTIHRDGGDGVAYHGILSSFDQLHAVDSVVFYRAVLVPILWWLSLTHHNQIFLNKTVKEIAEAVLTDGGLTALDFAFRLQGDYAPQPYVCQYGESHLDFLSRWLAREGIYYYFDQSSGIEKAIFTDTAIAHEPSPIGDTLTYAPPSGLEAAHLNETVQAMVGHRSSLPAKILLKDYNYEKPSLELTGADQTMAKITTAGGNKIHMEDKAGSQRILMQTPTENSWVRVGAVNDPPSVAGSGFFSEDGIAISTDKRFSVTAGLRNTLILGENGFITLGNDNKVVVLVRTDTTIGLRIDLKIGGTRVFDSWHENLTPKKDVVVGESDVVVGEENVVAGERVVIAASEDRIVGEEVIL